MKQPSRAVRRRLSDERRALTHHFSIAGQEGYVTVGVYDDGLPGEIFITMAKQGSTTPYSKPHSSASSPVRGCGLSPSMRLQEARS